MFNYGNANEAQKEAISATDGLVLITAGPGTGKTFTLVKRAVYLIQECGIKPEQIMMATFTEKAAKELITRITNELAERNVSVNVNEMYIGTFHSLCLRIIKENLEFTRLKRNYRLLDTFDQKYLVFRNFHKFKNIEGIDELLSKGGSWKRSDEICTYINHLSEEMVDIEALQSDDNPGIRTLGRVLSVYQEMLEEGNLIDFSTIQTECYKLLMQNKQILEELQDKLQYLMIDEYQDTNYIQEQIVFLLGAKHHNICVVGDDDQGLYRFRGATIRNILEFPHKFENEGCKIIPLVVNYRSNSDIVDFYNEWISTTSGHKFKFSWDIYRYQKKIEPHVKSDIQSPAVVKLFSKDDEDEWHEKILGFIKELKESGKLTDYNQLAFLFSSVKHQRVTALANFLERNGINVYSPRSDMFFKRDEIKLALGCLMLMFPKYVMKLEKQEFDFLQVEHYRYYRECIVAANEYVTRADNKELLQFIRKHGKVHAGLTGTTDYAYSGLLYKLFMFRPFKPDNEQIYYIIDAINDAINAGKQISFQYYDYTGLKKKVLKNKGEVYKFSPYKLLWCGDYYYVLGYSEKKSKVINFRVDRIASKPEILAKDIIPMPDDFDIENYTKEVFFMFSGEKVLVDLRCDNSLMKTMVDRFGEDVTTLAYDMTSFRVQTEVSASPTFFGWVFGFNGKVQILAPERVKEQYRQMIAKADENMQESE